MTRKEWLQKFVELCDAGANTLEFRRHCRVKAQHLPRHIRKLGQYRAELSALLEKEREQQVKEARLRALEEARRVRAEQRLAAAKAQQEAESARRTAETSSEADAEGGEEALGS